MRYAFSALLIALPARALAWSDQGHMASGLAVHDALATTDPGAVAAIMAIMRAHPDRTRFDAALAGLDGRERERRLFALMARWPDDVAGTSAGHPEWHYQVRVVSGWTAFAFAFGDARRAFLDNLAIARDPRKAAAARAVALCWVIHIAGDMHQPLHAGHRMSFRFPATDRAGSIPWVRLASGTPAITFHQYWDRAADRPGGEWQGAEAIAAALVPAAALPSDVGEAATAFDRWTAESRQAAATAYDGPALNATRDADTAPALGADYAASARRVAMTRLRLATVRIATLLRGFSQDSSGRR